MSSSSSGSSGGIGVVGLLGVAFVVLKLCGAIDWSWWWVTAPFWISGVLCVTVLVVAGILFLAVKDQSLRR